MLEAMRKHSTGIVVKGLLGLLILSFAAWGIGDVLRGSVNEEPVAEIGNTEITPESLTDEIKREMNRLSRILGTQIDRDQARALGIVKATLNTMVNRTLYGLGAKDLGVTVSDVAVRREIEQTKVFQNKVGVFDRFRFQDLLSSNGMGEAQYVALVRGDLARSQYLSSLRSAAGAPKALAEAIYRHRNEKRTAQTAFLPFDALADPGEPDAGALKAFHTKNAARFTAPEYRGLTYVFLNATDLAKEIAVSKDEIAAAFKLREDELSNPESRSLQHMLLPDEKTATRAHDELTAGKDFVAVAKDVAGMDAAALDFGKTTRDQMLPELADAAFSIPQGGFSTPIKSPLGWHILRVVSIERSRNKTLDEVKNILSSEIAREKAIESLYKLTNNLEDALGGGATLEEAAATINVKAVKVSAIDRKGLSLNEKPVGNVPPGPVFLNTAFSTGQSQESSLMETDDDGYFVLRVDSVTPPALRPLDTVKADVTKAWKAERRREMAKEKADEFFARVKTGADMKEAAKVAPFQISLSKPFTRNGDGAPSGLPRDLVEKLFKLKKGGAAEGKSRSGYYVARLETIIPVDPAKDSGYKEGVKDLGTTLSGSLRDDLLTQLATALQGRYPVSVNPRAVDQLF